MWVYFISTIIRNDLTIFLPERKKIKHKPTKHQKLMILKHMPKSSSLEKKDVEENQFQETRDVWYNVEANLYFIWCKEKYIRHTNVDV